MKQGRYSTKAQRSGFTLIELLVVIAIIAILAAILFPVFAQAREKARQTSCLSNEKQLGIAIVSYIQDYDETYPAALDNGLEYACGTPGCSTSHWTQKIVPYVKSNGVFACPDDTIAGVIDPINSWKGLLCSYSVNGVIGYPGIDNYAQTMIGVMGTEGYPGIYTSPASLGPVAILSQVNRPSDTIMMCEHFSSDMAAAFPCPANGNFCGNWSNFADGNEFTGQTWYPYPNGSVLPAPGQTGTFPTGGVNGGVSVHHTGMANFLFCDGHAKAMQPQNTNLPGNNMWDRTRS